MSIVICYCMRNNLLCWTVFLINCQKLEDWWLCGCLKTRQHNKQHNNGKNCLRFVFVLTITICCIHSSNLQTHCINCLMDLSSRFIWCKKLRSTCSNPLSIAFNAADTFQSIIQCNMQYLCFEVNFIANMDILNV